MLSDIIEKLVERNTSVTLMIIEEIDIFFLNRVVYFVFRCRCLEFVSYRKYTLANIWHKYVGLVKFLLEEK